MGMNNLSYIIWDKKSPINGVEAEKAMKSIGITENDKVYIIMNGTRAWMVQTDKNTPFESDSIETSAQLHLASLSEAGNNVGEA